MRYDLVVVGAGVAGCALAMKAAQAGFRVALVEARPRRAIGHDWEVTVNRQVFAMLEMQQPPQRLFRELPEATVFYAGTPQVHVRMEQAGFDLLVFRHRDLNRFFLAAARRAGVRLLAGRRVATLQLDGEHCSGVSGRRRFGFGSLPFRLAGRITVDASGVAAVLRHAVPEGFGIKREVFERDFADAHQETWKVDAGGLLADRTQPLCEAGTCWTRLGKYQAFSSQHLRRDRTLNLVFASSPGGDRPAGASCRAFTAGNRHLRRRLAAGGGVIPIRRSLDNLVGNGFLLLGDSACQVIPTMGSGIEPGLVAADCAARTVVRALNDDDVSRAVLWRYNVDYQRRIGAILAGYDVIRRFLQSLPEAEIDRLFASGLVDGRDFAGTFATSAVTYNIGDTIERIIKVIANPRILPLVLRFRQALADARQARSLYLAFPETDDAKRFARWQEKTNALFVRYGTTGTG